MSIADKLGTIADNQQKVYDAGKDAGYDEGYSLGNKDGYTQGQNSGYSTGYEAGTKNGLPATWDSFWDAFQMNGARVNYELAFSNGWTKDTFKPKYNIKPTGSSQKTFAKSKIAGDLVKILEDCKVELDTSMCTNLTMFFTATQFTRIGIINLTKSITTYGIFASWEPSYLETIDKLIVSPTNVFDTTFRGCTALKNLTIEGTIAQNGFNMQWSTLLSEASIKSIINALSDTTSGLTITLSKAAVDKAFETSPQASDGSQSAEWTALEGTKTNWTISLV